MGYCFLDTLGDINDESLCTLDNFVDGLEQKSHLPKRGRALAPFFPQDARIYMNEENPGIKLASVVPTTRNVLIASKPLKETIEKHCQGINVEYLPLTIYDHRRRPYGKDYFLVNPVGTLDCLDREASRIEWDPDSPGEWIAIDEYVLDREKVKSAPQLFRIDIDPVPYVLGPELAEAVKQGGFTNAFLKEIRVNRP